MQLLKAMQDAVKRGVDGLKAEATAELATAILHSQHESGGFCALDGDPDIYYSLFARLSLNALGVEYDRLALIRWLKAELGSSSGVDRVCAELTLIQEGERSQVAALTFLFRSLFRAGEVDSYKLFLTAFLMEELLPLKLSGFLIKRAGCATLRHRASMDFDVLSTPRAAVCALLASQNGSVHIQARMLALLARRHISSGGYASAPGAKADLLSTAVVLFVNQGIGTAENCAKREDLAFVEMCWQDDGLFSAAPNQNSGDLEHTFYALLALGCMRSSV